MTKDTFFTQVEACYQQQEMLEFPSVIIKEEDGTFKEYTYTIKRLMRPVTADLLEQENAAKLATANTIVDTALIDTIRASEQVVE